MKGLPREFQSDYRCTCTRMAARYRVHNNPPSDEQATAIRDRRNKAKCVRGFALAIIIEPIKFNGEGKDAD